MGVFNNKDSKAVQTESAQSLPIVNSHSHIIKSSEQYTKNIEDKPNWKLCICTVKMYNYRTSCVLHRSDIGTPYRIELWGDSPGSTNNWNYQYVGKVKLIQTTDSERITLRFEKCWFLYMGYWFNTIKLDN